MVLWFWFLTVSKITAQTQWLNPNLPDRYWYFGDQARSQADWTEAENQYRQLLA